MTKSLIKLIILYFPFESLGVIALVHVLAEPFWIENNLNMIAWLFIELFEFFGQGFLYSFTSKNVNEDDHFKAALPFSFPSSEEHQDFRRFEYTVGVENVKLF